MKTHLNIASYNCKSVLRAEEGVAKICDANDIVLLQEHWLTPDNLDALDNVHHEFRSYGVSAMDPSTAVLRGRPYGGVAALWRKDIDEHISILDLKDDRMMGLRVSTERGTLLLVCLYLPCNTPANEELFLDYLGRLRGIIDSETFDDVMFLGDWNAHIATARFVELREFAMLNGLCISDTSLLEPDSFTYISDMDRSVTSWPDHCVSSRNAHNSITNLVIGYDNPWSDHVPIFLTIGTGGIQSGTTLHNHTTGQPIIDWASTNDDARREYGENTARTLEVIPVPDAVACINPHCNDNEHLGQLDKMYDDIVQALHAAAAFLCPKHNHVEQLPPASTHGHQAIPADPTPGRKPVTCNPRQGNHHRRRYNIAGWNQHVKPSHDTARLDFLKWKTNGSPRHGDLWESMCISRRTFRRHLKWCKRNEAQMQADVLATKLSADGPLSFWHEVRRRTNNRKPRASSIEGAKDDTSIASLWADSYEKIFNEVAPIEDHVIEINGYLATADGSIPTFNPQLVLDACKPMRNGKAPGSDGIQNEHVKFASLKLTEVLSALFRALASHQWIPRAMSEIVISPVIKQKTGDVSAMNNYRPIALATTLSKVLERVVAISLNQCFRTGASQFAFKPKHGTDQPVFILKETVRLARLQRSPMFAAFLDLSKAYDRVNHSTLCHIMIKRGFPNWCVGMMWHWLRTQQMAIRWGSTTSRLFEVSNGVRQGGVLSPLLFNIYIDELLDRLGSIDAGLLIGGCRVNHLCYADDLVLLCPSAKGLQLLLNCCDSVGDCLDFKFNATKTVGMFFPAGRGTLQDLEPPQLALSGGNLVYVEQVKYLGSIITMSLNDNEDILNQRRSTCIRANTIRRWFRRCSWRVAALVYTAYMSQIYGMHLWTNCSNRCIKSLTVCYNNGLRFLLGLPTWSSASLMFATLGVPSFGEVRRKRTYSFLGRLHASENPIVRAVADSHLPTVRGTLSAMWELLQWRT